MDVSPWNRARQAPPDDCGGVKLPVVVGSPPSVQLTLVMAPCDSD